MDVEPVVHPLPAPRRFPQLLSNIDAGDLALVQVAYEGGVESHLPRDIAYSEQAPATFVFPVDRVAERNISHQEPCTRLARNAGKFIVELYCLEHFRMRWFEVNWRGDLASSSQHGAALLAGAYGRARIEACPQHPSVKNSREFFEPLAPLQGRIGV